MNVLNAAEQTLALWRTRRPIINVLSKEHCEEMFATMKAEHFGYGKQCRWLGWIQAACVANGCATLEEIQEINRRNQNETRCSVPLTALRIALTATDWGAAYGTICEDYPELMKMIAEHDRQLLQRDSDSGVKSKFKDRVAEVLKEELAEPESWWYLSFADEVFRGVVIIMAHGITDAVMRCSAAQINPGGQIMAVPLSKEVLAQVPEAYRMRLLTMQDVQDIWPDAKTIREHEVSEG